MVLTATRAEKQVNPTLKSTAGYASFKFKAMGSPCEVLFAAGSRALEAEFCDWTVDWVNGFERQLSRFRPDSIVGRMNATPGEWVELDETTEELFALCDWFHWLTGGVFDPTAAPLLGLWDYHGDVTSAPSPADIESALQHMGWPRVEREAGRARLPEAGMALDLGGIGKEYAVDRVVRQAATMGIQDLLVNFGHDLRVAGRPPQGGKWRVGLEDPTAPGSCWAGAALSQGAVCTSGNYLRFLEFDGRQYGHIIDIRSGYPVDNGCLSVTVIAQSCTEAGILATAAFILGPDEGLGLVGSHFGAEGCIRTRPELRETHGFRRYILEHT